MHKSASRILLLRTLGAYLPSHHLINQLQRHFLTMDRCPSVIMTLIWTISLEDGLCLRPSLSLLPATKGHDCDCTKEKSKLELLYVQKRRRNLLWKDNRMNMKQKKRKQKGHTIDESLCFILHIFRNPIPFTIKRVKRKTNSGQNSM
jgi:hypothetical protein